MRMLFVCTTSDTARDFLVPIAEYERERGHEVELACSFEDFPDAPSRVKELRETGFIVHEIPFAREINPAPDLKAFLTLTKLIRNEEYDLVHCHTSKASFIARFAAKVARCPIIIYTAHDFFFRAYDRSLKRQFFIWLEQISAPWCDRMLFVSEAVRQEAIRYRLKPENELVLVGNGIDTAKFSQFATDPAKVRAEYGIYPDELLVGNIGRLVDNKGIDTFLRATAIVLQQLPDVRFIIGGDGPLRGELEELARSLGISDSVQFIGFLPDAEDVMKFMSSLDVFVLPTRREGLGLVFLEAMSLQCPVVGSRISPVTEVVKDGETGILATVDRPEAFAEAIETLLKNPELRKKMGAAGPAHVEREFGLQQVFERIDSVYQKMAYSPGIFDNKTWDSQIEPWTAKKWQEVKQSYLQEHKYTSIHLLFKRMLDVAIASVGILVLFPLLLLIAVVVKLSSSGPVLFCQERLGKKEKTFTIYKFRTMVDGAIYQGAGVNTFQGDPRITLVGKFLREYHLDELPQLFNVLQGDMSLVGPRPLLPEDLPTYTNRQKLRLLVKPGITAWEAVNGGLDNSLEERLELDVWYVNHFSFWLDLAILLRTIPVVLRREGLYEKQETQAKP